MKESHWRARIRAMHRLGAHALSFAILAAAMLRGVGEFASLQRWRMREWIAR